MERVRYALPKVLTTNETLRIVSNYLSHCIWPVVTNCLVPTQSRKQCCSSFQRLFFAARNTRVMSHSRAEERLTSQRVDSRIPLAAVRTPGYRLRAPKIGRLHIRFYFRGGRSIACYAGYFSPSRVADKLSRKVDRPTAGPHFAAFKNICEIGS